MYALISAGINNIKKLRNSEINQARNLAKKNYVHYSINVCLSHQATEDSIAFILLFVYI